jgi:hypothetical protein
MTGTELRELRILSGKKQKDFYAHIGVKDSYGSLMENHYADQQIPKRLESKVMKRYGKLIKGD